MSTEETYKQKIKEYKDQTTKDFFECFKHTNPSKEAIEFMQTQAQIMDDLSLLHQRQQAQKY